jgi:hypothetical protein
MNITELLSYELLSEVPNFYRVQLRGRILTVGPECKIMFIHVNEMAHCRIRVVLSFGFAHYPTTRQRGSNEDHPISTVTPLALTYFHRLELFLPRTPRVY